MSYARADLQESQAASPLVQAGPPPCWPEPALYFPAERASASYASAQPPAEPGTSPEAHITPEATAEPGLGQPAETPGEQQTGSSAGPPAESGAEPKQAESGAEPQQAESGAEPRQAESGAEPRQAESGAEPKQAESGAEPQVGAPAEFQAEPQFPSYTQAPPAPEPPAYEPVIHEPVIYGPPVHEPPLREPAAEPPADEPPVQELPARPPGGLRTSETADSLTADMLLRGRHKAPSGGWRRAVYRGTGGLIRAPQSAAELRRRELTSRARTPVSGGHHRVAVMSLKGGVGKTTTTVGLGATLASVRGDRIIAVDANPDRGTLSDKLRLETAATVRDLLNERDQIQRYADVRAFTTQALSRLEVLASDRDPTVSVAFSEEDYYDVAQVLEHYYSICLADCGTGLLHSAMAGVLRLADQIVLVSSPSVDGARSASATLDWLHAHGYGDLVRQAVVVLSVIRPRSKSTVDMDRLEQHFAARSRAVVRIPYDPYLEEGAEVDLAQLNRGTADAYLALAAEVGDGFARSRRAARSAPAQN